MPFSNNRPWPYIKAFPSYFWLIYALFGQAPRAGSGKTAAAQNDIKARFSVEDGLYIL